MLLFTAGRGELHLRSLAPPRADDALLLLLLELRRLFARDGDDEENDEEEEVEVDHTKDLFSTIGIEPIQTSSNFGISSNSSPEKEKRSKKVRFRRPDTNVISINFGTLIQEAILCTGDAKFCLSCKAAFNTFSEIKSNTKGEEIENSWICEFCGTDNSIEIDPDEVPKGEIVDYILSPPSIDQATASENTIVFCIDISGSMGVSYEIQGKVKLKGNEKIEKLSSLNTEQNANGILADQ